MAKKIPLFLVLAVFVTALFAQPANDNCIDAIQLTNLNGACVDFNSTMATFDLFNGDCVDDFGDRNIWFSFVAQGPDVDISVEGGPNDIYATLVSFDPNPCVFESATQFACGVATGGNTAISIGFLTTGNTYFIAVTVENNAEVAGTICVNNPDPNAVTSLPSLGQWQLILLGFILLIVGVVKLEVY
ncbi:MAG: hypothetical protein Sapg2KO_42590 [Saprospiraceae bacterium]